MAHATNRTEMLAKALKRARPDFSLHNSRVFARAVIDAPAEVFGQKPLTFLPLDQSSSYRWRAAAESAGIPVPGSDNVKGEVLEFPDAESARNAEQLARANATGRYIRERYAVGRGYGPDGSDALPDQPAGDFPDDDSARLAAEIANIGTEPVPDDVIFRRRGQEVTEGDARPGDMVHSSESNRMIGVVVAVHPDGSKDMVTGPQSLPIMLALTEEAPPAESAGIPLNGEDESRVPVSPADARPGDILVAGGTTYLVLDAGKVLDPDTGVVTTPDSPPEMTGAGDGFFRVARSGAGGAEAEALPGDLVLAAGTNEPIGAVIGGGMVSVPIEDDPRAREERCALESLLASGCGLRRIDIREVDPLVSFRPLLARVVTVELLLSRDSRDPVGAGMDVRMLYRALAPRRRKACGIDNLHDLYEHLNVASDREPVTMSGAGLLAARLRSQILEPVPTFTPLEDPVPASLPETPPVDRTVAVSPTEVRHGDLLIAGGKTYVSRGDRTLLDIESREIVREDELSFTGPEEGYFRPVGRQGEWARFVENLPAGYTPVISTGLQPLDPLKLIRPTFDLPASADRPPIVRRDASDAGKLWEETVFHVGVGTEGPVMWSPAEAGSMLVTGRTGSGSSVFVQGMVTDARISGWDIIWLDRHIDADTYAATIANAHALSARRTADQAPVLVVLDEFQAFSRKFAAAHNKAEVAEMSNQMLDMLELAGTSHVHLLLVTHDLHAQTIPSTWLPHFGAAVTLGQPSEMALRKLAGDVKVPSEAFPRAVRGRAAFFDRTQPGTYQVVQTYLPAQAKDALAFAFGEDEMARMDPELARKLVERPDRPLTPHEFIAGINGGPKLWDAVGEITQNKNPVDSMLGSMMGALFGRPASAPAVDPSKPNHFYFDSLGDPLTCTEDHNHPSGPDDEPGHNVKIRAQRELERLPEPITRRVAPRDGDRRDPAPVSELGLGIGPDGERVTYAAATDGPLLIIGDRGRGKTSMVSGLNREAEALGWDTVWLETQKTSRYVRDRLDEVREEIGRRVVGASDVSKPMLVTLDDSLFTDWGDESRTEISSLVTTLLEKGPGVNVHLVAATGPRQRDYFLSLWPAGAAVLLTGAPTAEEASALFADAADLLPRSGWEGSGKMVLVRDPKVTEGFLPAPLRAYTERPPKRYDDF